MASPLCFHKGVAMNRKKWLWLGVVLVVMAAVAMLTTRNIRKEEESSADVAERGAGGKAPSVIQDESEGGSGGNIDSRPESEDATERQTSVPGVVRAKHLEDNSEDDGNHERTADADDNAVEIDSLGMRPGRKDTSAESEDRPTGIAAGRTRDREQPVDDVSTEDDDLPEGWVDPEEARRIFDENRRQTKEARLAQKEQSEEEKTVQPAIRVVKDDAFDEERQEVLVTYTIRLADAEKAKQISGLVLSQRIPPKWDVEESTPPYTSYDANTRVAKWLFINQPLQEGVVSYRAIPVEENASIEDWSLSQSWYTYREPGHSETLSFSTESR